MRGGGAGGAAPTPLGAPAAAAPPALCGGGVSGGGAGGSPSRGGGETARPRALPSGRGGSGRVPTGRPRFVRSGRVPPGYWCPRCGNSGSCLQLPPLAAPVPPTALRASALDPCEGDAAHPPGSSKAELNDTGLPKQTL